MKTLLRYALLALTTAAGLAIASPALAAYTPKLDVGGQTQLGASGTETIHVAVGPNENPTAKVTIYAAKGYKLNPNAASGTSIGEVAAKVTAADLGGATLPLSGQILAADATTTILSGGVPVPLSAVATVCTGAGAHAAFWVLVLQAAGQTLQVPAFVDTTAGQEAAFSALKIQVCLPPPDVPPGTPGRATFGAKLFDAVLRLKNVLTNPDTTGLHAWTSVWTPYNPGVGTANPLATVEARSIVPLPVVIRLAGKYDRKTKSARLAGSVRAGGQPAAGQTLPLFGGSSISTVRRMGSTSRTNASGLFTAVRRILRTTFFTVRVASPPRDFTAAGCAPPVLAPAGCVSATIGPVTAASNVVKVVVPKKK